MTLTSLLIPLGFLLFFMPWPLLLAALPVFALFHGAAVVNVGAVGLQPGYFLALLVIARTLLEITLLRQPFNRDALLQVVPLSLLILITLLILWISVAFFTGKVLVIGGTDGYNLDLARPYQFRRENLTQVAYLVINTLLVYAIAHQASQLGPSRVLRVIDVGLLSAIVVALGFCGWQLLAESTGIWFPDAFLFSNAGYYRADGQAFYGYLRLNGPFAEPSALAYFLGGFLFYIWKRARLAPTVLSTSLTVAVIGAIALAFSTTGYFILAAFTVVAAADLLPRNSIILRMPRLTGRGVVKASLLLGAGGVAAAWVLANFEGLLEVLQVSLFEKSETSSFEVRSGAERMALDIVAQTAGLGIGLGSHKANSLTLTLLSNLGFIGIAFFGLFIFTLLRPQAPWPAVNRKEVGFSVAPLRFFIIGLLLIHAVSNPNFNVVLLWIGFGLMAGYRVSMRRFVGPLQAEAARPNARAVA